MRSRLARFFRPRAAQTGKARLGALYNEARRAVGAREPEVALPLLEEILELDPDHAQALEGKLLMLHRKGEIDPADSLALEWLGRPTPNRLKAVARYRLALHQPASALEILDEIDRPDARLEAWRARALFMMGRYTEAQAAAESALSIDPGLVLADRILGEIEAERGSTERTMVPLPPSTRDYRPIPKRVLHMVTSSLPQTVAGYTIRSQAIGTAQRGAGLEPHFVTKAGFPEYEQAPAVEVVDGVPYHRLAPGIGRTPEDRRIEMYAELARDVVEEVRPSVLHPATGFPNAVAALSLREVFDIPVVYEVRGFLEDSWVAVNSWADPGSDRYRWRRKVEIECMQLADAVVTLAWTMKNEIESWGIPEEKIQVVPNAVDVDRFRPRARNQSLAASLGIEANEVTVGYISSLSAYEGLDYLIEAISKLTERGISVRGVIVGDGPERNSLQDRAAELGIADRVTFVGAVAHEGIGDYYSLIDVFVVPRTTDRVAQLVTPLKPYEAMAMSKPVVASDVPALREMVIDGETGLLFESEDAGDLAEKIALVAADRDLADGLGARAREWVAENRSWRVAAAAYAGIYRQIGAGGSDRVINAT